MEIGTAVTIVCIVLLTVAVIAGLLYWHSHKASEAATFANHGITISALQTGVDHIEDKVSNAVTSVEASSVVQDVDAGITKAKDAIAALEATVAGAVALKAALAPAAAPAAASAAPVGGAAAG